MEIEKREEMEKSEEKKERKIEKSGIDSSKVTKFSNEGKEKVKRYKIGDGMFVEDFVENEDQVDLLEKGKVWIAEDLTLEIRNDNEDLITYFDLEEVKQFTKCEITENETGKNVNFITGRNKSDYRFGVGFYKAVQRNMTFKYIEDLQKEKQRDTPKDDLGFGLFD